MQTFDHNGIFHGTLYSRSTATTAICSPPHPVRQLASAALCGKNPCNKTRSWRFLSSNSRDNNAFTINIAFIALEAWKMLAGYISINVKRQKIPLSRQ
tara:strand:- start:1896 stop:2189 length:294 start_codon:yes stop_codon:yes gene_type:complete